MSTVETLRGSNAPVTGAEAPDFADVYGEHLPRVWRFVRSRIPDHAEAHDVTSDVFVRAWRSWDRFDPSRGPVEPWLFTIAARAITDWYRKRRPEPTDASMLIDLDRGTGDDPEAETLQAELLVQLAVALETLSDREREGLALRFAARLSSSHIAMVLGTSPAAAKQLLHRAVLKLRDLDLADAPAGEASEADLEQVIDEVLERGSSALSDAELQSLLVHIAALHDAPTPDDLSQKVSDCVTCEAMGVEVDEDEDEEEDHDGEAGGGSAGTDASASGRRRGRRAGKFSLSSLVALFGYSQLCLACALPSLWWIVWSAVPFTVGLRFHEASLITSPILLYVAWRGVRRHGQANGFRVTLAGAAILMAHTTFHYAKWVADRVGEAALDPLTALMYAGYENGFVFGATDAIGGILVVLGLFMHLSALRRWRQDEMTRFQKALVVQV